MTKFSYIPRIPRPSGILTLALLIMIATSSLAVPVRAGSYSNNALVNPSFEQALTGWGTTGQDAHTLDWTISANSTRDTDGGYAARMDMVNVSIGFIVLYQVIPGNTFFSNLTNTADTFDVWFYFEPKYSGLGDFQIKFLATNAQEMDYVFDADPSLSYPNQTFLDGRPLAKSILLNGYHAIQWHHFAANVASDWQAPMKFTNSSGTYLLPGFGLNQSFYRVEFDNLAFQVGSQYYSQIVWVDNVKLYFNTSYPPPPPQFHSASFNFTDLGGNIVDQTLQWKLFNSTGQEVQYIPGQITLPPGTYTLDTYFPFYSQYPDHNLIHQQTIPLDTSTTVQVSMISHALAPGGYIAVDSSATVKILRQDAENLTFTATGAGSTFNVIITVPSTPSIVAQNGIVLQPTQWTYDSTTSKQIVRIATNQLGRFSLFFGYAITLPQAVTLVDRQGTNLGTRVAWKILDSQNGIVCNNGSCLGEKVPIGNYYLEAYFEGFRIYRQTLAFDSNNVVLQMTPAGSGYLAFNTTITSISISGNNAQRISFTAVGRGPALVVVQVSEKPLYVELNGTRVFNWTYDSTSKVAAIETTGLGTYTIVLQAPSLLDSLENTPLTTILLIAGTVGGILVAIVVAAKWSSRGPLTEKKKLKANKPELR